jgi:DNA-binding NarL/FixJ family response regulator
MAVVRIMVVEDFEEWRRFVLSLLQQIPTLRVICEVSDGLEAVRKAEELKPDLIFLDIGLPSVNGIEAARRIRLRRSNSKILFMSQESDPEVVQEALSVGRTGYLLKADASAELLAAVEATVKGEPFLSRGLAKFQFQRSSGRTSSAGPGFAYGMADD